MELSIDTSTDWGGVALSCEGKIIVELTWNPGQNHTLELTPNIKGVLQAARADLKTLTAVFVAKGPGSYNGLRAGISTAKGLAFSLNIPIVGVPTLEIEAYAFAFTGLPICPIHNAGRGEIAVALYILDEAWQCMKEEHLTTIEKLCVEMRSKTLFCGEIPEQSICQLKDALGDKAVIPAWQERLRRPSSLAELGWQRLKAGQPDNLTTLQPIYLRQPPITKSKKKY